MRRRDSTNCEWVKAKKNGVVTPMTDRQTHDDRYLGYLSFVPYWYKHTLLQYVRMYEW